MSIFKGEEVRLLKARVDENERRLMQMCKHTEQRFIDYRRDKSDPWYGGRVICGDCDEIIREFINEAEFLKAKHKIMREIIKSDAARIAEPEKREV